MSTKDTLKIYAVGRIHTVIGFRLLNLITYTVDEQQMFDKVIERLLNKKDAGIILVDELFTSSSRFKDLIDTSIKPLFIKIKFNGKENESLRILIKNALGIDIGESMLGESNER